MPEGEFNVLTQEFVNEIRKWMSGGTASSGAVSGVSAQSASEPRESPRRPVILINSESTDVPAGGCLAVVETYQSKAGPIFWKCAQPSTTFHRQHTFAPLTGLKANGQCLAQDGPAYYALYNSGTPANDEGYGPTPGQYYLTKSYPQCSVCTGVWDSSAKIMLATLGVIEKGLAKSNGTIANAGSGAISIYAGAGAWTTDTGQDPTAVNLGPPVVLNDLLQFDHLNGQMVFSKVCTT